jgi:predicted nucleotidyltransferase
MMPRGVEKAALDLEKLKRALREHLPQLRARYRVKSLGLFGSYVRGEQRKRSDLDVLVDFEEAPSLFELMDMEDELARLIGTKVDLVTRKTLRGRIGQRILQEVVYL